MSAPDVHTAAELARLRAELHAMGQGIERIAKAVEKDLDDLKSRTRALEAAELRRSGAAKLLMVLATLPAGLVYWLLRGGK